MNYDRHIPCIQADAYTVCTGIQAMMHVLYILVYEPLQ